MKRVILLICFLFLFTACSSPPKVINTFTVNLSVWVLSSGGGGGMDLTYRVEKGEIVSCKAEGWNGRTGERGEVPCELEKLKSGGYGRYYELIHPITMVKEGDPRSGEINYGNGGESWKIIEN